MEKSIVDRLPRVLQEEELVSRLIIKGEYGEDLSQFVSTRELAETRGISLVTAQKIMVALRERGLIELKGKKYFLSYGKHLEKEKILGMHVPNIENQYFSSLVGAVRKSAMLRGYKLIVAESGYDAMREYDVLQMFKDLKVKGVLSCPGIVEKTSYLYKKYSLPLVFLGRKPDDIVGQSVSVNTYQATRRVADHLINNKFINFAYIGLKEVMKEDVRLDGYRVGLSKEGFSLQQENIMRIGINKITKSIDVFADFIKKQPKPVGIFCFHDLLAVEVLRVCHMLNICVPDEVAVMGFDDLPIASCLIPTLSTVSYKIEEMATMAVRLLNSQIITKEISDTNYYVEPTLIIRESSTKEVISVDSQIEINMNDLLCNT